jgi:RNA polymerase sporulation-specific sigma factor
VKKVSITGLNTDNLVKLSAKESEEMIKLIKNGRTDLKETFLLSNARLVLSMVQRFKSTKESPDDLFQVGMLGLIKAMDNFDTTLNVRFSTYAVPMVLGEIRRYVREGTAMKVGRSLRDIAYQAIKARERLELNSIKEVSLFEIAQEINVPYYDVVSALDATLEPVSIYEPVYSDSSDGMMLVDQLTNPANCDYMDISLLRDGIAALPQREKQVLIYRYYQGRTQMEIATALNMSQAQISRLEKSAISQLRVQFV